jgi:hypothetical protein
MSAVEPESVFNSGLKARNITGTWGRDLDFDWVTASCTSSHSAAQGIEVRYAGQVDDACHDVLANHNRPK